MAAASDIETRFTAAEIEAMRTGKRVRVHAETDEDARWLSEHCDRNIFTYDYVEFGVEVVR